MNSALIEELQKEFNSIRIQRAKIDVRKNIPIRIETEIDFEWKGEKTGKLEPKNWHVNEVSRLSENEEALVETYIFADEHGRELKSVPDVFKGTAIYKESLNRFQQKVLAFLAKLEAIEEEFEKESKVRIILLPLMLCKDWDEISEIENLALPFITACADKINWKTISEKIKLTEDFIDQHKDKVYWDSISCYQTLSESFLRKHQDLINWKAISFHQTISETFIREFKDKVEWRCIAKKPLSNAFREEFKEQLQNFEEEIGTTSRPRNSKIEFPAKMQPKILQSINSELSTMVTKKILKLYQPGDEPGNHFGHVGMRARIEMDTHGMP